VAEDYFAAMQRVEERLDISPEAKQDTEYEVVNVQEQTKILQLIKQLETPDLCLQVRLGIASQLREALGFVEEYTSFTHASSAKGPELKYQLTQTKLMKIIWIPLFLFQYSKLFFHSR
jgi:hypothetical protein